MLFRKLFKMGHYTNLPTTPKLFNVFTKPSSKTVGTGIKQIIPVFIPPKVDYQEDLFRKIRPFFIVGKFLGLIPFSGVFQKSYLNLDFSPFCIQSYITLVITALLFGNFVLESVQTTRVTRENALELAVSVKRPIFYGYGLFLYLYFFLRARKIINLFHNWVKARTVFSLPDKNLRRDVMFLSAAVLTSACLENGVLHMKYFAKFDNLNDVVMQGYRELQLATLSKKNSSVLEVYYRRSHYDRNGILGYSDFYAVLIFLSNKLTLYCWNYADLFLSICGRAIYFRFKCLYETSVRKFVPRRINGQIYFQNGNYRQTLSEWHQMVKDHEALLNLVKQFEDILSPLIFLSYALNIFYICLQAYMGLHSEDSGPQSIIQSIYAPWSLIHLGLRTYIVSISLARVNVYAHKIMDVIIECPTKFYDKHISRLDRRVTMGRKIGFTGFGCFTVTKPFILQVIGVIFTFEIVLLQGSSASNTETQTPCCCTKS